MQCALGWLVVALCLLDAWPASAQSASAAPTEEWGLHVSTSTSVQFYPGDLLATFQVGSLTLAGCSPLYLAHGVDDGCPLFRDEPAWAELTLRWAGPGLAQVWPKDGRWANVWLEEGGGPVGVKITVTSPSGAAVNDGAVELADGTEARVRLDLSRALESLPLGPHTLCYELSATTTPETPQRSARECIPIAIVEPSTQREHAEYLRRKAINLLSELRCAEALPVIADLLQVHPTSASAFRLRGIVAELQQRNEAAASDYGTVVRILRTDQDQLLPAAGIDFQQAAQDLAERRDSMVLLLTYAPELNLLGPPGDRPTCKSARR